MNSRDKIRTIFNRENTEGCGFWTGNPHHDTEIRYLEQLRFKTREEIFVYLQDDCRWVTADSGYKHPEGKPMFDIYGGKPKTYHGQPGVFAECEDTAEVEKFPWPDTAHLDFTEVLARIRAFPDKAVFTGFWCPFFHQVADFFGMENYFTKMYTDPDVVAAVTGHMIDFYVEANRLFFQELGDDADIFFFGNDFGTQLDLLISPEMFNKFVLPGFKRLIDVAREFDKKVLLHSCGSIYNVIPTLIDAGIDALHPLQAKAANMEADRLAREFGKDIAFVGGVDTQDLLVNAPPQAIRDEVHRLRDVFGPNLVISPSHEALLPNVPLENTIAMAEAARD